MEELKLIFLDIDGVVNSTRSVIAKIGRAFTEEECEALGTVPYGAEHAMKCVDPVCVALVNKLIACDERIGVVLSSTHRRHFHHGSYGSAEHLQRLRVYLGAMGFKLPAHFNVTECLERPRGSEVQQFLENVVVNEYVILDDGTDFKQGQPLVRVDPVVGMDFNNYVDACKFLAVPEPSTILL